MKELFLLGAGASIEAGIPGAYAMTQVIADHLHQDASDRKYAQVIDFVIGGLLFQQGVRGNSPFQFGVNVESLFNAVSVLDQRHDIEISPFIDSWHKRVEDLDSNERSVEGLIELISKVSFGIKPFHESVFRDVLSSNISIALSAELNPIISAAAAPYGSVTPFFGELLHNAIHDAVSKILARLPFQDQQYFLSNRADLELDIFKAIDQLTGRSGGRAGVFGQAINRMIRLLIDIVWIEDKDRVKYLQPLINLASKRGRLVVATLNYDNAIELVSTKYPINCNTCLYSWTKKGYVDLTGDGLHLLKLHGSVDWEEFKHSPVDGGLSDYVVQQVQDMGERRKNPYEQHTPAVIFGGRNKLTTRGPFLDMLRAFQEELLSSERLTIIGYSFGDSHINSYITRWFNHNSNTRLRIIDPGFDYMTSEYAQELKEFYRRYCGAYGGHDDRIEIVNKQASTALAEIYG